MLLIGKRLLRSSARRSFFRYVPNVPMDAIKGLTMEFQGDKTPGKILLGEGVYRNEEGKPHVLKSVRAAEKIIFESRMDHEYPPVFGVPSFIDVSRNFVFGAGSELVKGGRVASTQALSGTGALRNAAEYLHRFVPANTKVLLPAPTWVNHNAIFANAGFQLDSYRYYDKKINDMDVEGCLADLRKAPMRSIVLMHAAAHNPTGCDPTLETWKRMSKICLEREHICFFDSAYQGFASGDVERDIQAVRLFIKDGNNPLVCQSYAKNFGLYGERAGMVHVVCPSKTIADNVTSQFGVMIRSMYSCPPIFGARIVSTVCQNKDLYQQWLVDVKEMADRIISMRKLLRSEIEKLGSKKKWDQITKQIGMFCYTGLTPEQVLKLKKEYHIYMTIDGRISISGLNKKNAATVAKAFHEVTKK